MPGITVPEYGFSGCRRISVRGNGKKAFAFAILRKIIMEIPAIYLLNRLLPLYGMAYAQVVTEVILAAAAVITLRRMFREK